MRKTARSYLLNPERAGWRWRVIDPDGEIVGAGFERSRADAEWAIELTLHPRNERPADALAPSPY